ncbi:hypothetical protein ACJZ2D_001704 [Fusarium nematophilum]
MAALLTGTALITGAGSGIGQATSLAFVKYGIRKLALLDIDDAGLDKTADLISQQKADEVQLLKIKVDVGNDISVIEAIQKVVNGFGRIDIAVNNAGIGGPIMSSTDLSVEEYRKVIDVNMISLWVCQREEIKQMLRQEPIQNHMNTVNRGVIVNMSSIFGLISPSASTPASPYNASNNKKCELQKPKFPRTTSLRYRHQDANSFAKEGIRINAICPGYVATRNLEVAVTESEVMRKELDKVPMGRLGSAAEIAEVISFLSSPMSSYMTGSTIVVDGGYTSN